MIRAYIQVAVYSKNKYYNIKRLNQGHLPPKPRGPETDMSRPGIEPESPLWEASTLEKSHSNSLFNTMNLYNKLFI